MSGRTTSAKDYLRATLTRDGSGALIATPFAKQDSSMLSLLVKAQCLVVRPPHAPAAPQGTAVDIIPLEGGAPAL